MELKNSRLEYEKVLKQLRASGMSNQDIKGLKIKMRNRKDCPLPIYAMEFSGVNLNAMAENAYDARVKFWNHYLILKNVHIPVKAEGELSIGFESPETEDHPTVHEAMKEAEPKPVLSSKRVFINNHRKWITTPVHHPSNENDKMTHGHWQYFIDDLPCARKAVTRVAALICR